MNAGGVRQRADGDNAAPDLTADEQDQSDLDEAVAIFVSARPRLLAIAYRILGSTNEAEDVVQDTWLRWQQTDRYAVENPPALLATITTRLALNVNQSGRRRRETPVDFWAHDVVDATSDDPASRAERREAVEQALVILLGRLTPRERTAYLLREAFDYPYGRISELLHLGVANTRQLVCRARLRVAADGRAAASPASHQRFLQAFLSAARAGDLVGLEELLAADLPR